MPTKVKQTCHTPLVYFSRLMRHTPSTGESFTGITKKEVTPMAKQNGAITPQTAAEMTIDAGESDAMLSSAVLAKLATLGKLDFTPVEADLWKPEEIGNFLMGVYLGKTMSSVINNATGETVPFLNFACSSIIDGTPMVKRILESATLKRVFDYLALNTAVKVTFDGEQPSKQGNPLKLYTVAREYTKL